MDFPSGWSEQNYIQEAEQMNASAAVADSCAGRQSFAFPFPLLRSARNFCIAAKSPGVIAL